jgi:diguanylate cyclase (GGDEF)-like protein
MERPGNRGEARTAAVSAQRGRQVTPPSERKHKGSTVGTPRRGSGRSQVAERKPGARRPRAATAPLKSPAPPQSATLDSLLRAITAMSAAKNVHDVTEILTEEITRVLAETGCQIIVCLGHAKPARRPTGARPRENPGRAQPESAPTDTLADKALQRRRLTCADRDGRMRLVIPLLSRNEPWGYVDVQSRRASPLAEEDAAYLQSLANGAAAALEIAWLRRNVGSEAMTDSVTGFYSGWHFYERLHSETARARRYNQPLAAIVFEVDDFEDFVEERGQAKGTYLLRAVSRLLRGSMRHKVDLAYRCTGARFALLLPNTPCSKDGAALVAERMRNLLEVTDFRTGEDEYLGRFTLSAGVAGFPAPCDDADELAAAAEEALCEAKSAGKNRVRIYHE